jgi:tetratricopeptide (TPR) repeat protein
MTGWHDEDARSLLCDLAPGQLAALLHLLLCPACREWAVHHLLQEVGTGTLLPGIDQIWSRLEGERGNLVADSLLADLLGYPKNEQDKALQESRFQSQELLVLLLETSHEAQPQDCERSEALAVLASRLTAHLRREMDEILSALFFTRAAVHGNALRLRGELAAAEDQLGRAAHFLAWPFESSDRAAYCRALALLRWEQGRLDEAEALLQHAARGFQEYYLPQEEGACLALLGLLCLEQNRTKAAVRCLQTGRAALAPEARPWLTVRAGLSLALGLADLGQAERAQAVLKETWWRYGLVRDESEHVRICWLEGKVCARLGLNEEAEAILSGVRGKLISEYSLPEAVFCSLDLAPLLVESGRSTELRLLLQDIEQTFAAEPAGLDATRRAFDLLIANLADVPKIPWVTLCMAETALRRFFRSRGYRVARLPFA